MTFMFFGKFQTASTVRILTDSAGEGSVRVRAATSPGGKQARAASPGGKQALAER